MALARKNEVALAVHDPFRETGSSGRINDRERVIGRNVVWQLGVVRCLDQIGQQRYPGGGCVDQHKPWRRLDVARCLLRDFERVRRARNRADAGMTHHVISFRDAEFRVHRHDDRPDARECEQQQHVRVAVGRHHRHAIAFAHTAREQHARRALDRVTEFVPCPALIFEDDERLRRIRERPGLEQALQRKTVLRIERDDLERRQMLQWIFSGAWLVARLQSVAGLETTMLYLVSALRILNAACSSFSIRAFSLAMPSSVHCQIPRLVFMPIWPFSTMSLRNWGGVFSLCRLG